MSLRPLNSSEMYKDSQLQDMRVHDMVKIYREIAPDCWSQKQALDLVVMHEAPRFYILPHAAYNKLRLMFRGEQVHALTPRLGKMYKDLYQIVVALSERPENQGKSLRQLCAIAVNMRAPEFYVSSETFRKMLTKHRKKVIQTLSSHHANRR